MSLRLAPELTERLLTWTLARLKVEVAAPVLWLMVHGTAGFSWTLSAKRC